MMIRGYATAAKAAKGGLDGILDSALSLVPKLGWQDALTEATRERGLSDQSASIFPYGAFDVVLHHHKQQTNKLKSMHIGKIPEGIPRVRKLVEHRLLVGNKAIGSHNLQTSIAMLTQPTHLRASTAALEDLVDEIWFLAGDLSTDTTWYTRRGSLAAIYAAAEMFQSRDKSKDFRDTSAFVAKQMDRWENIEYAEQNIGEWITFNARSAFNIARTYF